MQFHYPLIAVIDIPPTNRKSRRWPILQADWWLKMIIITLVYYFAGEVSGNAALAAGEDDKSDLPETIGHRFSHCCPQMYRCNASSIWNSGVPGWTYHPVKRVSSPPNDKKSSSDSRLSREIHNNCPIPQCKECQRTKAVGNNFPTKEIYVPHRNGVHSNVLTYWSFCFP